MIQWRTSRDSQSWHRGLGCSPCDYYPCRCRWRTTPARWPGPSRRPVGRPSPSRLSVRRPTTSSSAQLPSASSSPAAVTWSARRTPSLPMSYHLLQAACCVTSGGVRDGVRTGVLSYLLSESELHNYSSCCCCCNLTHLFETSHYKHHH